MKLILTTDVSGLGGPGDIVEVKDGYGRNCDTNYHKLLAHSTL